MAYEQAAVDLGIHDPGETEQRAIMHMADNSAREALFSGNRSHGMINPTVSTPYSKFDTSGEPGSETTMGPASTPTEQRAIENMEAPSKRNYGTSRDRSAGLSAVMLGIAQAS